MEKQLFAFLFHHEIELKKMNRIFSIILINLLAMANAAMFQLSPANISYVIASTVVPKINLTEWQIYKVKFGKVYGDSEDRFRRNIYNAMKLQMEKHQEYSEHGLQTKKLQVQTEDLLDATYDERYIIDLNVAQNEWESYKV